LLAGIVSEDNSWFEFVGNVRGYFCRKTQVLRQKMLIALVFKMGGIFKNTYYL
jgi:hypothetical protein